MKASNTLYAALRKSAGLRNRGYLATNSDSLEDTYFDSEEIEVEESDCLFRNLR